MSKREYAEVLSLSVLFYFGGAYVCVTGSVKSIDEYERLVVMEDGVKIPIGQIHEIESKLFTELGYA